MLDPTWIQESLASHPARTIEREELRPAAVLLPLFVREEQDALLFTRRTENLHHHRGEVAFPGGKRQAEDADLLATALRETEEEVGIAPADVTVLGRLDDFISIHGYRVSPFVGTIPRPDSLRVNPEEIAEVFEVPLDTLADPGIFRQEDWRHRGENHPVYFYTVGEHKIWGLTAAIVRQFFERLGILP
jgi:8-oxo-dGTP pyrophosphatase MutT (NUDIX family)